jgi:hypothetical protein
MPASLLRHGADQRECPTGLILWKGGDTQLDLWLLCRCPRLSRPSRLIVRHPPHQGVLGMQGIVQALKRVLCRAGDMPIQRHVKIKGAAKRYGPQWEV